MGLVFVLKEKTKLRRGFGLCAKGEERRRRRVWVDLVSVLRRRAWVGLVSSRFVAKP